MLNITFQIYLMLPWCSWLSRGSHRDYDCSKQQTSQGRQFESGREQNFLLHFFCSDAGGAFANKGSYFLTAGLSLLLHIPMSRTLAGTMLDIAMNCSTPKCVQTARGTIAQQLE